MATPNYGYEKRQRELAKKKKKEEKLKAKADGKRHETGAESGPSDAATGARPVSDRSAPGAE